MGELSVFDFASYKTYLRYRLGEKGSRSGRYSEFSSALGCQSSFVSQVLGGALNLSLEQAIRANPYLEHDSSHSHFFLLLVQAERSGTEDLRNYFQKQIDAILADRTKVKSQIVTTQELSDRDQARYYSQWDLSAVHMALAVPKLRSPQALSRALHLSISRVDSILRILLDAGLVEFIEGEYRIGSVHLHLGQDSPFLHQHHTNWRVESLRRLQPESTSQLHYSGVFSLSQKDYHRLRANLVEVIKKNLDIVKPSEEQIVVSQTIDLIPIVY